MLTRCPKCDTLYRLTTAQIEAAEGRVRCSRCNEVFNAIEHLRKTADKPLEAAPAPKAEPPAPIAPPPRPPLEEAAPAPQKTEPPPIVARKPPEPPAIDMLSQPQRKGPSVGWWLLALLLTVTAAAQLAWLDRRALIQDPQGRRFLASMCVLVKCALPPRRATDKFRVLSRDMSSHPQTENALLFLLVMANQADFSQPYPHLQLDLFDANRQPAGQRIFKPEEYLSEKPETEFLTPNHAVYIRLELVDPGPDISGFEIKFL